MWWLIPLLIIGGAGVVITISWLAKKIKDLLKKS